MLARPSGTAPTTPAKGAAMSPENPKHAVEETVEKLVDTAKDVMQRGAKVIPGAPGSAPPTVEEPTEPREPLPPKTEHGAPETVTPTGAETGAPASALGQQGAFLT